MTGAGVRIEPLALPTPGLEALRREAASEGHQFLDRLAAEWESGANRFDRAGERLLGAFAGEALVGLGGLNLDPYAGDPRTARLRHLYVGKAWRRREVATRLVDQLLASAAGWFDLVRLRTDDPAAAAFYARRGFAPVEAHDSTHEILIGWSPPSTTGRIGRPQPKRRSSRRRP